MQGRWGELDVSDVVDAIVAAHAAGWATPATTVVTGASAGGFTALGVAGGRARRSSPASPRRTR